MKLFLKHILQLVSAFGDIGRHYGTLLCGVHLPNIVSTNWLSSSNRWLVCSGYHILTIRPLLCLVCDSPILI